jgi:hypothetical protein
MVLFSRRKKNLFLDRLSFEGETKNVSVGKEKEF